MANQAASSGGGNRVLIAIAGFIMQVALGAIYAWSVFRVPLTEQFKASVTQVNLAFTITILMVGFAAFGGGLWMKSAGPRIVAITAGVLYGSGIFLASFSTSLTILYLTYGVMAGIGLGLGYIVPIATLVKWFPDKRGTITGVAVAGFGLGAVVTTLISKQLVPSLGVLGTFRILGIIYLVAVIGAALFMRNPPAGFKPAGWEPDTTERGDRSGKDFQFGEALKTWQWFALWALLFLNASVGIGIIAEAAPMTQQITGATAAAAATLVILISFGNAAGRFLWAAVSDAIGRKWTFLTMFLLQAVLLIAASLVGSYVLFAALVIVIISCYGGGFGTMPAFAADYFGPANVGQIYGLMLTAWSAAAVLGPIVISRVVDATGVYTNALYIFAAIMLASTVVAFIVRPPKAAASAGAPEAQGART